jgi:hypothetical protein
VHSFGLITRGRARPDTIRNSNPTRIFVHPDSIPKSDIDFNAFIESGDYSNLEFMQVEVPGLAYRILIK